MSISNPSEQQPGLFGKIGLFFLKGRIRAVAKAASRSSGYGGKCKALLGQNSAVATGILIQDVANAKEDAGYRRFALGMLREMTLSDGEGAWLQLLRDINIESLSSIFPGYHDKLTLAIDLCKTGRFDVIPLVGEYWVSTPIEKRQGVLPALQALDSQWNRREEARQIIPRVIQVYQDARSRGRSSEIREVISDMERLGAPEYIDILRDAVEKATDDISQRAVKAWRAIALENNMVEQLEVLSEALKRREARLERSAEQVYIQAEIPRRHPVEMPRQDQAGMRRQAAGDSSIQPGQYFEARGVNVLLIYGECLELMGPNIIYAKCYSRMCPGGESGTSRIDRIIRVIDKDEFESAISRLR